jgi:hypothetical protein
VKPFLILGPFNDAVSSSEYVALNGRLKIDELERMWKEGIVAYFKVLSCHSTVCNLNS